MHHDVANASAEALAKFGAPAIPSLTDACSHPEMWIRIHAIRALGKMDDPQVAPILLEMLNDPEREVKKHVISALGELRDARTLPALQEIMSQRGDREMHALSKAAIENIQS
jgi:HEAT repeat protein